MLILRFCMKLVMYTVVTTNTVLHMNTHITNVVLATLAAVHSELETRSGPVLPFRTPYLPVRRRTLHRARLSLPPPLPSALLIPLLLIVPFFLFFIIHHVVIVIIIVAITFMVSPTSEGRTGRKAPW